MPQDSAYWSILRRIHTYALLNAHCLCSSFAWLKHRLLLYLSDTIISKRIHSARRRENRETTNFSYGKKNVTDVMKIFDENRRVKYCQTEETLGLNAPAIRSKILSAKLCFLWMSEDWTCKMVLINTENV